MHATIHKVNKQNDEPAWGMIPNQLTTSVVSFYKYLKACIGKLYGKPNMNPEIYI